jgi:predicted ester cyclase
MNIHRFSRRIVCPFKSYIVFAVMALLVSSAPVAAAPVEAPLMSIQFFESVLGGADLEVAATILSADAVIHTPEGVFTGSDGAGQYATSLQSAFSSVTFVTQEPAVAGDFATLQWRMTGIHTGTFHGLDGYGAHVSVNGIAVFRFDDSAIVEQWIAYDRMALVNQIQAFAQADSCDADCLKPGGNR